MQKRPDNLEDLGVDGKKWILRYRRVEWTEVIQTETYSGMFRAQQLAFGFRERRGISSHEGLCSMGFEASIHLHLTCMRRRVAEVTSILRHSPTWRFVLTSDYSVHLSYILGQTPAVCSVKNENQHFAIVFCCFLFFTHKPIQMCCLLYVISVYKNSDFILN
jgi:hypothetical protein